MNTYETIYLMNETSNLLGQALCDVITVTFTIVAAGLIAGDRLSRSVVAGITILSALWVLPMLVMSFDQVMLARTFALTLTPESLGEFAGIASIIGANSVLQYEAAAYAIITAHFLTYLGAIWFLNDSRKRHGVLGKPSDAS